MLTALIQALRPRQWTKNAFVFAALVFDTQLFLPIPLLRTVAGFALMCLISGAIYIVNDLADIEKDLQHPVKRLRPIPSGRLPRSVAIAAAAVLPLVTISLGMLLSPWFALILSVYFGMFLLYSWRLKDVVILDVLLIAAGFVLRVGAGVTLIAVERFSPWLYVCTILLALFLGFGKRRSELVMLMGNANQHRSALAHYTLPLLDNFITIVSGTTIVAYSLYTFSAPNLPLNHAMMLTIPFVVYGIFRYLYLIHVHNEGGAPEDVLLVDRPLQLSLVLWGMTAVLILYLGR